MQAPFDTPADAALVDVGRFLRRQNYQFTTVTPLTHARYLQARPKARARDARDVFGWNLPFIEGACPSVPVNLLRAAGVLQAQAQTHRSQVRFSSLGPLLLAHGAYPTCEKDAVFFGPDTYRFVTFLRQNVTRARRAVDIGSGSGAGGLALGSRVQELVCADLSTRALRMSAINAAINVDGAWGAPGAIRFCESDLYRDLSGTFDVIMANPPYIQDDGERMYRHGGDTMGTDLSVRIVREGLAYLSEGGRLLLYTGSPVVRGVCLVTRAVRQVVAEAGDNFDFEVSEIDPDVFGEELERPCYKEAERIAAVGIVVARRANGLSGK